jgi:Phage portal protein
MTYSNMEQKGIDFLVYSVQWWLTLLEQSIANVMPGKKHVMFDTSVLLRTDLKTLMEATALAINSKQMTPDEARAMRQEPPLTDAQKAELAALPSSTSPAPATAPAAPPPALTSAPSVNT